MGEACVVCEFKVQLGGLLATTHVHVSTMVFIW